MNDVINTNNPSVANITINSKELQISSMKINEVLPE